MMTASSDLVARLQGYTLPSTYELVGDNIEGLFDPGLRHKSGKKPFDYLKQWLSMLRPFACATRDDSWGEMEKLLCIVMRNYVRLLRLSPEAADRILALEADKAALVEVIEWAAELMGEFDISVPNYMHYALAKAKDA